MIKELNATQSSELIAGQQLEGCEFIDLDENVDERGSFTEIFQTYWGTKLSPVQWSMVKSERNVLRGMHYHQRHDEYFCLVSGSCYLGLKDLRTYSKTYLDHSLYSLNARDLKAVVFPPGIIHGWYFTEPSVHIQSVSEAYRDYAADDNLGCRWDDIDLGIPWPFDASVLSTRAQGFGSFNDLPPLKKEPTYHS